MKASLGLLPKDIKRLLLAKHLSFNDVLKMSLVSKEWRDIVRELIDWQNIFKEKFHDFFPREYDRLLYIGGDIDWCEKYISTYKKALLELPAYQRDLFIAVGEKNIEKLREFYKFTHAGSDGETCNGLGMPLFLCAALNGFHDGCRVLRRTGTIELEFLICIQYPIKEIQDDIDEFIPSLYSRNNYLNIACEYNHFDAAKYLITKGASVNVALSRACESGNLNGVRFLTENGADVNKKDDHGRHPFNIAMEKRDVEIMDFLKKNGVIVDINQVWVSKEFSTILLGPACDANDLTFLKWFVDNGAEVNQPMMLRRLCENGHAEIVKFLIEKGADVNSMVDDDRSPLASAVFKNHFNIVKMLVERGADVNQKCHDITLFEIAYDKGFLDIAKYLIANGTDMNLLNQGARLKLINLLKEDPQFLINGLEKQIEKIKVPKAMRSLFQDNSLRAAKCLLKTLKDPSEKNIAELDKFNVVLSKGEFSNIFQLYEMIKPELQANLRKTHH